MRRGHPRHHPGPTALVPGVGHSRFAPLRPKGVSVDHVYVATTTFAALLESALHEVTPPDPRVHEATLARWMESQVALSQDVRLIDLRDAELARLGIDRASLVSTNAAHYPCTRAWATRVHGRTIGGQATHGLVWNSRQTELHARALTTKPATRDLVAHHPAEVAVVWSPPATSPLLEALDVGLGPLDGGDARSYIADLTAFLGIITARMTAAARPARVGSSGGRHRPVSHNHRPRVLKPIRRPVRGRRRGVARAGPP